MSMGAVAITRDVAAGYLVPEERALAMVKACAQQLSMASTIPDILRVVSQADAISAVMEKIKATEAARKAALRLRIEAEAQLGRITAQIPQIKRGPKRKDYVRPAGVQTKREVLVEYGIHNFRAAVAERLAEKPAAEVDAAIARAKGSGVRSVLQDLGLCQPWKAERASETRARHLAFLASEAIELLERCARSGAAPHAGTVAEMRGRLQGLTKATSGHP